jgi:small subunit ribosomal protein S13
MAEKKPEKKQEKQEKSPKVEKKESEKPSKGRLNQEEMSEMLIRIYGYDIPASKNIITGLIRIKGISWAISNSICIKLGIPKSKKISELSKPEIQKIETFIKELPVADFLKNRRLDRETGESKHFVASDLEIKKEFDIKRLKEIKSYRGLRHSLKLPSRGQRTRSHFRSKGVAMGVKKKAK